MIRVNFGQLLIEEGRPALAEEQFIQALVALRHDATTRCRLGQLYLDARRVEEAMGNFREAARLDPGLMTAYFGLAQALQAQGEHAEAIAICKEQARTGANRMIALLELGHCHARAGQLAEAEAIRHGISGRC
jgi:tetratricopeptide (TPR) repeat protein